MQQVMLDIETLGTSPGCIVPSIGAVVFTLDGIKQDFHVHIDPLDSEKHGLFAQASTVMWWLDQPKEAQGALTAGTTLTLEKALRAFSADINWEKIDRVWCNGAAFDFPILKAAHGAIKMNLPWAYYKEMDFRTFKNLYAKEDFKRMQVEPEIKHDALADARAQAMTLINLMTAEDLAWAA